MTSETPPDWVPPRMIRAWAEASPKVRKLMKEVHDELVAKEGDDDADI